MRARITGWSGLIGPLRGRPARTVHCGAAGPRRAGAAAPRSSPLTSAQDAAQGLVHVRVGVGGVHPKRVGCHAVGDHRCSSLRVPVARAVRVAPRAALSPLERSGSPQPRPYEPLQQEGPDGRRSNRPQRGCGAGRARLHRCAVATEHRSRAGKIGRVIVTALTPAGRLHGMAPRGVLQSRCRWHVVPPTTSPGRLGGDLSHLATCVGAYRDSQRKPRFPLYCSTPEARVAPAKRVGGERRPSRRLAPGPSP